MIQKGIVSESNCDYNREMAETGLKICPVCGKFGLPNIPIDSRCTAVKCQVCGRTLERKDLETKQVSK